MRGIGLGSSNGMRTMLLNSLVLIGACVASASALATHAPDSSTAKRLVEMAWRAQLDGDLPRYFALLRQAVRVAPEYELARWQLGQVHADGEWLAVEEAQRRAAADPRQAKYRQRREAQGATPQGQLELARWCRKNNLDDEARFHWASVLSVAPNHEEAQRALGMRWHDGRLMTLAEIDRAKRRSRELRRAYQRWSARVAKWERAVAGDHPPAVGAALDEIRGVADRDAIPAFESLTLDGAVNADTVEPRQQIALAFLDALGKMDHHDATESLVRHAVLAPLADVRASALERLRGRPLHDYVPLLLSGLVPQIESWFHITTGPDGSVHYRHSLHREGSEAAVSFNLSRSARQHDRRSPVFVANRDGTIRNIGVRESDASVAARMAVVAASSQRQFTSEAVQIEHAVAQQNEAIVTFNGQVTEVLAATTGEDFGKDPAAWAEWWQNYNEYYSEGPTPSYEYNYVDNRYHYYRQPEIVRQMSCFAKGTLVWTKTGQRPIESLELGDLVLAQNVETGELKYQPVIGRTVRPPSAILKLSFAGEELRTTLGHPLWVAGTGWRMAKELGDGAILHGVTGSPRIESIAPDGEEEAYNLVVAEFNTYFVGERGVLVHDNTPRRPTRATVPGLATK